MAGSVILRKSGVESNPEPVLKENCPFPRGSERAQESLSEQTSGLLRIYPPGNADDVRLSDEDGDAVIEFW
ncbi:hypothetical protein CRG98_045229, partial [Punica granatum]